jgi:hypothetical protein
MAGPPLTEIDNTKQDDYIPVAMGCQWTKVLVFLVIVAGIWYALYIKRSEGDSYAATGIFISYADAAGGGIPGVSCQPGAAPCRGAAV